MILFEIAQFCRNYYTYTGLTVCSPKIFYFILKYVSCFGMFVSLLVNHDWRASLFNRTIDVRMSREYRSTEFGLTCSYTFFVKKISFWRYWTGFFQVEFWVKYTIFQLSNLFFFTNDMTGARFCLPKAIIRMKYCRYGVKLYPNTVT